MAWTLTELEGSAAFKAAGLLDELLWVHGMIRQDLATVRQLAIHVTNGADPEAVIDELAELQTNGPLWKLRVNCLYYCRFVHSHHNLEDAALFPAIRRIDPTLDPVVNRLEADHLQVSGLLDAIEDSARGLGRDDNLNDRQILVDELNELATHLLDHLGFEEASIGPVLQKMEMSDLLGR